MTDKRQMIAKNIAGMLRDGDLVNLGVGIPTLVGNYISSDIQILLHGENGCVGQERELKTPWNVEDRDSVVDWLRAHGDEGGDWRTGHRDLNNASDELITLIPGACCFNSSISFAMARGGHLDATVLGGLQVDEEGSLANWTVPGKMVNGMGGAMDLVSGAKRVIVAMEHCSRKGEPKLVRRCTMPLTGLRCVDTLVTELCIVEFSGGGPLVTAMTPGLTREALQARTGARLTFSSQLRTMEE